MDVLAACLTVILLSPVYAVNTDLNDGLLSQRKLKAGTGMTMTGRHLQQGSNEVLITEGHYNGEFFNHDDITVAFEAGSQISRIRCALIRDPHDVTEISPCTSPVDLSAYLEIDGLYGFAVFGNDNASGRTVNDSNVFIVDRTPPQTDLYKIDVKGETAEFKFKGEDIWNVTDYECQLDTTEWESCSSPKSYSVELGDHVFRVRAIDQAGNKDNDPPHHEWTVTFEDVEASVLSNEEGKEIEEVKEDGDGSSKTSIIAVAVFVPVAVVTLVGVVIFLNRKKLASAMGRGEEGPMTRIP